MTDVKICELIGMTGQNIRATYKYDESVKLGLPISPGEKYMLRNGLVGEVTNIVRPLQGVAIGILVVQEKNHDTIIIGVFVDSGKSSHGDDAFDIVADCKGRHESVQSHRGCKSTKHELFR